ncbi:MAG: helix-hairpin-helix domain-containing protein [Lachnospiraceae bacterium]|nr:helix-hairpin-helix domain-containing protein [Lachnospiraceae bacterium]
MQRKCNNLKKMRFFMRRALVLPALAAVFCVITGCEKKADPVLSGAGITIETEQAATASSGQTLPDVPEVDAQIVVHVCGAVEREGVYRLEAGARVVDAVTEAGGFSSDADRSYVNQAAFLTDGMRLKIPTAEETAACAEQTTHSLMSDELLPETVTILQTDGAPHRVNINTATAAELCTLNGVGEARAAEIIRYRETHGAFARIEDLMKVTGIKEKLFEKIRDAITV